VDGAEKYARHVPSMILTSCTHAHVQPTHYRCGRKWCMRWEVRSNSRNTPRSKTRGAPPLARCVSICTCVPVKHISCVHL
jgi:hypothetical protein